MEKDSGPGNPKLNKRALGLEGEEEAARYLEANGYKLLERNYRCGRMGEIDIIAAENEYICFVEVKTRTGDLYGAPCEAVDMRKQTNIRRLAWSFLKSSNLTQKNMRFDVVEVLGQRIEGKLVAKKINLIRDAF